MKRTSKQAIQTAINNLLAELHAIEKVDPTIDAEWDQDGDRVTIYINTEIIDDGTS